MKKLLLFATATLFATSLFAQSPSSSITGSVVFVDPQGEVIDEEGVTAGFDNANGFGVSYSKYFGSLSLELGASRFSSDFVVSASIDEGPGDLEISIGDVEMTPLTATLRYHFMPASRISPYVGGGASYVMYDDLTIADAELGEEIVIEFEESVGYVLQAGIDFTVLPNFAINFDAKYLDATSDTGFEDVAETEETEIDPLITSIGLSYRF